MRFTWRLATLFLPILGGCAGGSGAGAGAPAPSGATSATISAADLRLRIGIFADDSMQGRRAGTPGNVRGNAYVASELARLGLTPAGDEGTFLQRVPLTRYAVSPSRATLRAGSTTLGAFKDYYPYQATFEVPARHLDGASLVYIGTVADSSRLPSREALRGKLVVFRSHSAGNSLGAPDLSPNGPLGLIAGIAVTQIDPLIGTFEQFLRTPRLVVAGSNGVPPGVTQPRMLFLPTASVPLLFGKPLGDLRPGDTGPALQGDVTFDATELQASNVVAILEGADPTRRGQYLALGAHNDAIGIVPVVDHDSLRAYNTVMRPRGANDPVGSPSEEQARRIRAIVDSLRRLRPARPDSIVNGADDDGSGSMGLLEIAEAVTQGGDRPRRSLLFVWHTGEESGLQGSRWFTDHPTVPRDSIVAQVNVDMIARGGPQDEAQGGPGYIQAIGTRRLSTELGDLAEAVNREGNHGLIFDYSYDVDGHPDNFYCRSDHYMYARYGIPIAFFSTGGHRDYHQVTDEPEYLDYDKYARVTRFIADLAERVANVDHRPVVDHPKPDPSAPCQQ
ncbi:MAG: M28 family metallopeptidase [Gemmatimonadales bacterium]